MLCDVIAQIDRLSETANNLLRFSRSTALHPAPTSLSEIIKRTRLLIEESGRTQDVQIVLDIDSTDLAVHLDAEFTARALLNIALNAFEAMHGRGQLTISSRCSAAAGVARVTLTDTGPGMPSGIVEKIFSPFFTTKTSGTGLGLSIVEEIIERQGGIVEVHTAEGEGTSFVITLPLAYASRRDEG